jgi:hypothetical protein
MPDIWIPGWTRVDLGPDGGPYDDRSRPKGCMHTTEGTTLAGAEGAYKNYPPHLGYDPNRRLKHQYVALNRSSYAFRGSESDDEYIIQVEVVGFAAKTHQWSNQVYSNIAQDVIKPLEELIGIPRQHLRFYRADEGIVLARPESPVRLSSAALRNYSGWLGHQHIPAPDSHWDPGGFLMDLAFSFLEDDMQLTDKIQITRPTDGKTITVTVEDILKNLYSAEFYGSNNDPWKGAGSRQLLIAAAKEDTDEAALATMIASRIAEPLAEELAERGVAAGATPSQVEEAVRAAFARAGTSKETT